MRAFAAPAMDGVDFGASHRGVGLRSYTGIAAPNAIARSPSRTSQRRYRKTQRQFL